MKIKKICFGADHAGFEVKNKLLTLDFLKEYELIDFGTNSTTSCNYPEFAIKVGEFVTANPNSIGILVCGSGTGMCVAANKVKGIRAALGYDEEIVKLAVNHNNANVLCFGARFLPFDKIVAFIKIFLKSEFENGRHMTRINEIISYENGNTDFLKNKE